jgi:hypothetical protein
VISPAALYNAITVASVRYVAHHPYGLSLYAKWLALVVNFSELRLAELRKIHLLGTSVNRPLCCVMRHNANHDLMLPKDHEDRTIVTYGVGELCRKVYGSGLSRR